MYLNSERKIILSARKIILDDSFWSKDWTHEYMIHCVQIYELRFLFNLSLTIYYVEETGLWIMSGFPESQPLWTFILRVIMWQLKLVRTDTGVSVHVPFTTRVSRVELPRIPKFRIHSSDKREKGEDKT